LLYFSLLDLGIITFIFEYRVNRGGTLLLQEQENRGGTPLLQEQENRGGTPLLQEQEHRGGTPLVQEQRYVCPSDRFVRVFFIPQLICVITTLTMLCMLADWHIWKEL
jgi:hypothetical protein